MNDNELRDLLSEAVSDVEPRYALDEIRARTTTSRRRWPYAASGGFLAVAASVTAFVLLANDTPPQAVDPGSSTSRSPSTSATALPSRAGAVYYVGDTPDGPRLYREFQQVEREVDLLSGALDAAIDGRPLDSDYYSAWPQGADSFVEAGVMDGVILVELSDSAVMSDINQSVEVANMAIQQVIYTAQAIVQERLPVQFTYRGNPVAQVLGVPTSEPLANGPVLDTLALVSLTTPAEGMVVDNDEPLVVEGAGNSFEGNIVTRLEDASGAEVLEPQPVIAGWMEERLFPFQLTLDLTGVPPGEYVVTSQTDDPSGEGLWHEDSRNITVVD